MDGLSSRTRPEDLQQLRAVDAGGVRREEHPPRHLLVRQALGEMVQDGPLAFRQRDVHA